MLRYGQIIKHIHMLDICFEISKVSAVDDRIKLEGVWLNQGFKQSWVFTNRLDKIEIMKTDLKDWRVSYGNEINPGCHRFDKWVIV